MQFLLNFYFDIIIDSYAIVRNNIGRFPVPSALLSLSETIMSSETVVWYHSIDALKTTKHFHHQRYSSVVLPTCNAFIYFGIKGNAGFIE